MEQKPSNNMGIGSLVCGIIGVVTSSIFGIGCILGIIALVLSAKSKKEVGPNGMATAGLVLGIIAVIWGAIWLICTVCTSGLACMGAAL